MSTHTETDLFDEDGAAAYLGGVPAGTLRQWRSRRQGPAYVKYGHHVRYRRADLDAFIAARRIEPTPGADHGRPERGR